MPKISIILPALNAAATIGETMDSLCAQTFRDFELIVIDDGSSDNTAGIVQSYSKNINIKLISHISPMGVAASLNTGILQSDSELVARIDADDIALPTRFEKQVAFLDSSRLVDICGTAMQVFYIDAQGKFVDKHVLIHPNTDAKIRTALMQRCPISHPSVMFRRSILQKIGVYDTAMDFAEDYDLWCRASMHGLIFANLDDILVRYRAHEGQVSNQKALTQYIRDLAIKEKYIAHFIPGRVIDALPRLMSLRTQFKDTQDLKLTAYQCLEPLTHLARVAPDADEFTNMLKLCASRHWISLSAPASTQSASPFPKPILTTDGTALLTVFRGGIGNQLFQQAFALSLSRRLGFPLYADFSFYINDPYCNQPAIKRLFPDIQHTEATLLTGPGNYSLVQQNIASLDAVAPFPVDARTVVLNGYWQNEDYFDDHAVEEIRTQMQSYGATYCSNPIAHAIQASRNAVAVHLRRRDYAHMGLCKPSYYLSALAKLIEVHPDCQVYVFSDEPNFARHLFSSAGYQFSYINGPDDLTDLYLMSLCRHFIISNSSYSWWGARLAEHRGGTIYHPSEWTTIDTTPSPCPVRWHGLVNSVSPFSLA